MAERAETVTADEVYKEGVTDGIVTRSATGTVLNHVAMSLPAAEFDDSRDDMLAFYNRVFS